MSSFNDPIDSAFRQKADMGAVFVRQLDRKNHQGSTDYPNSVLITLNNLPKRWRDWVLDQDSKYTTYEWTLVYKQNCGIKLGTAEEPMLVDETQPIPRFEDGAIDYNDPNIKTINIDKETGEEKIELYDPETPVLRHVGEIDYDDPNILSPKLKEIKHIDYIIMDAIVAEAAEHAALTWTQDPLEQDAGDTEEYIVERKRTPFRKPRLPDTEG